VNLLKLKNNFDILRLILAVLVFFAHWNILTLQELSNPLFHLSGFAVDMFFIVSGFLIFWSFDSDQNKKHFYIKRFFRIFPLYAFLIVLQTLPFDFSYSFYILHFPVIQLALYFGINPSNPLVSFVSLFAVILFLSYFSEKYIEKRFVKIGKEID
jgi:peptidoglycan/LPS O-acetylase OafA/YrhL